MDAQAFVPQTPVKGFKTSVFHRFARMNEVELHPTAVHLIFQCPELAFGAVIDGNRLWAGVPFQGTI